MAKLTINNGTIAGDGTGENLHEAFAKVNSNFTEVYDSSDANTTKLAGIEAGATADQTGSEIKTAYELEADTNAFTDAEKSLLANQSGTNTGDQDLSTLATKANVLELDNVDAYTPTVATHPATKQYVDDNAGSVTTEAVRTSGALMDDEVTNLTQVKAFDATDYATAAQGTTADNAEPAQTEASQVEMEAGTETAIRSMSPVRVKQAIDALGGGGGLVGDGTESPSFVNVTLSRLQGSVPADNLRFSNGETRFYQNNVLIVQWQDAAAQFNVDVNLTGNLDATGTVKSGTYTVATLPTGAAGDTCFVSDASVVHAGNSGSIVANGATNFVPVYFDGTNWRIT